MTLKVVVSCTHSTVDSEPTLSVRCDGAKDVLDTDLAVGGLVDDRN